MDLTPQLAVTLICLLVCAGGLVHRCGIILEEVIQILNTLSVAKTPCMERMLPDVTAPKNSTDEHILCRATTVLHLYHFPREVRRCLQRYNDTDVLADLGRLSRAVLYLAPRRNCSVDESTQSTLKDFLQSLKDIMQKKFSQCGNSTF